MRLALDVLLGLDFLVWLLWLDIFDWLYFAEFFKWDWMVLLEIVFFEHFLVDFKDLLGWLVVGLSLADLGLYTLGSISVL